MGEIPRPNEGMENHPHMPNMPDARDLPGSSGGDGSSFDARQAAAGDKAFEVGDGDGLRNASGDGLGDKNAEQQGGGLGDLLRQQTQGLDNPTSFTGDTHLTDAPNAPKEAGPAETGPAALSDAVNNTNKPEEKGATDNSAVNPDDFRNRALQGFDDLETKLRAQGADPVAANQLEQRPGQLESLDPARWQQMADDAARAQLADGQQNQLRQLGTDLRDQPVQGQFDQNKLQPQDGPTNVPGGPENLNPANDPLKAENLSQQPVDGPQGPQNPREIVSQVGAFDELGNPINAKIVEPGHPGSDNTRQPGSDNDRISAGDMRAQWLQDSDRLWAEFDQSGAKQHEPSFMAGERYQPGADNPQDRVDPESIRSRWDEQLWEAFEKPADVHEPNYMGGERYQSSSPERDQAMRSEFEGVQDLRSDFDTRWASEFSYLEGQINGSPDQVQAWVENGRSEEQAQQEARRFGPEDIQRMFNEQFSQVIQNVEAFRISRENDAKDEIAAQREMHKYAMQNGIMNLTQGATQLEDQLFGQDRLAQEGAI